MALMRRFGSAFLTFALATSVALAAPLGNEDVIRMVRGGLSDATVIQAIDAAEPAFDTSPDALVKLKQAGVSEAVIQRMLARAAPAAAAACKDCGVVDAVRQIDKPGTGSGVGAVAGGVTGAVIGRNVASDRNRTAGTVVGAVGGAVAGHQIEKYATSGKSWQIDVRFDDGARRSYTQDTEPRWRTGDRVKLVNGALTAP